MSWPEQLEPKVMITKYHIPDVIKEMLGISGLGKAAGFTHIHSPHQHDLRVPTFMLGRFQLGSSLPPAPIPASPPSARDIQAIYDYLGALLELVPGGMREAMSYLGHLHAELEGTAAEQTRNTIRLSQEMFQSLRHHAANVERLQTSIEQIAEKQTQLEDRLGQKIDLVLAKLAQNNEEVGKRLETFKTQMEKGQETIGTQITTLSAAVYGIIGPSAITSSNHIVRVRNQSMEWSELQADGPAHEVFKLGLIDGSDLNLAAPMGHKPSTDHALWFPISEAELAHATVEQVDPLLYFYAISDPKRPNKRFNQDGPLNEKRAALLLFLAGKSVLTRD